MNNATSNKMRAVRQSGTAPELAVRAALESLGYGFVANARGKPGSPDAWLIRQEVAIFVHGCFWHRHAGCRKATTPKTNRDYWLPKFQKNVERDARKIRELADMGYASITVWQCETMDAAALERILAERVAAANA